MNFHEKLERIKFLKRQISIMCTISVVMWLLSEVASYVVRRDQGGIIWILMLGTIVIQIRLIIKVIPMFREYLKLNRTLWKDI